MKCIRLFTAFLVVTILISSHAFAQLEIGASYELRDSDPQNGFGLRVQQGILGSVPMIDLGIRAHFSYFNEENNVSQNNFSYSRELTNYDFGLAAYGGVTLGLLQPYVGIGLGSETLDITFKDASNQVQGGEGNESNIYWNMFTGAKVTVIPLIKPFVEYRYTNSELSEPTLADAQNGRVIFGVLISF